MDRPGSGGWAGAPNLDPGLRDATFASLAGWRRRLESSSIRSASSGSVRQELAIIGKEAAELRGLAIARGATSLAQHLERISAAAGGPPAGLADALERLAQHVGSSPPDRPAASLGLQEPRHMDSIVQRSLAEPPLLDLSQAKPVASPIVSPGTLLSARPSSRPAQGPGPSPPPPAPISGPPPVHPRSAPPVRLPDSVSPQVQPNFLGTLLGFRAFGRKAPDPSGPSSPQAPKGSGDLLGLRARPGKAQANPLLQGAPGPLPRQPFADRGDAHVRWGSRRPPDHSTSPRQRKMARSSTGDSSLPKWFYAVSGGLAVLVIATVLIIVKSVHGSNLLPETQPKAPSSGAGASVGGSPPSGATAALSTSVPPPGTTASGDTLIATFQPRGKETPELRALLETQSRLAQSCRSDPASCGRGWTPLSRDAFNPIDRTSIVLETAPAAPLPAWLQRLKLPADLPIRDDASLRAMFDFNTKNIAGRQRFQAKIFECAAYADIFDSTLVKYGAPSWLSAVVFQESGCYPRAKSEVGAVGLWQFMPESARAYGLRVVDGEIDERLNPIKSTDAAIHFLTDLQRTLGAWDLVMAAYNMGPYAVLARLAQVGNNAGFWDLAHANLLPEETAGYVPAIEADALALQNLSRLQFSRDGKRLEATAEISVKPGERLSLLARAASTTTLHIRELNPEFLRDVVPEGETTARVPDAEAHRAEAFMESWSPDDNRDTCVPEDFDWGVREFESSKFAKGCGQPASP
jgi:hypothetical protein